MIKRPVIIDCDPGLDDAIMLFLAKQIYEIDVLGITTVAGNVSLDYTTQNALNILSMLDWNIDVYRGCQKPIKRKAIDATHIHGINGLKSVILPNSHKKAKHDAISFMYEQAKKYPQQLELLAVGPLTNIAQLIIDHDDIKSLIKSITIMGGSFTHGNITPAAEFNIYADPEAAKIVFDSKIPISMIGLDVTMKDGFTQKEIDEMIVPNNPISKAIKSILDEMIFKKGSLFPPYAFIHDAMALIYMIDPSIVDGKNYYVDIETESPLTLGQTVIDYLGVKKQVPHVFVPLKLYPYRYKSLMRKRLAAYHENNHHQIFILGSLNMDLVYSLNRIPEQGETYHSNSFMQNSGGKGSNQAVSCRNFGLNTSLIGAVGNDGYAEILLNDLIDYHVDISYVKRSSLPTGSAVILLTKGDNRIILNAGANHSVDIEQITHAISNSNIGDFFLTQFETPIGVVKDSLLLAKKKGLITILNPSPVYEVNSDLLNHVDILIMNEIEAASLSNKSIDDQDIIPYFLSKGVHQIIITMGSKGVLYNDQKSICFKPSLKTQVVDTTAAGDTFIGALLSEFSRKSTIHDAVQTAIYAATMAIEKEGAQKSIPKRDDVIERFYKHS